MILFKRTTLIFFLIIFCLSENYSMDSIDMNTEIKLQKNKWWEFLEPKFRSGQCLKYHIRALFNNFFRKWCGVYKSVELGYVEFFYGTVNGIGWYPQFLNFHDHFRMGLFEFSYNSITTIFRIFRDFFTKGDHDFSLENIVIHFLGGLNFSIINFKMYNNLIRLNFINVLVLPIVYFKFTNGYTYYGNEGGEYSHILFFGKDLPELQDFFKCEKYGIKHFLLILNLILPEIYIDINFFDSSEEKQQ